VGGVALPTGAGVQGAAAYGRLARGAAARRVAIWGCLVVLPLADEASDLLPGAHNFYSGDAAYWYSGLDVRLVLALVALGLVLWGLRASGQGAAALGWPSPLRPWQVAVGLALLAGATALVFYHPPAVSDQVLPASASTPVTVAERACLVALAALEAPVQELVWRGAMITWLEPSLGTGGAALLSVASFVFLHPVFGLTWGTLHTVLPLALAYTALFLWRRSLVPGTLLHFVVTAGQLTVPVAA
jgi:membrane protease YdiL (CAAX protease family)